MSEIEKMKRYIKRTKMNYSLTGPYQMNIQEMFDLSHMTAEDAVGAICLAFDYGKAKGYRAAKADGRTKDTQREEAAI